MLAYIARRLLLVIPTLLGIMIINFVIVQEISGQAVDATARISGDGGDALDSSQAASDGSSSGPAASKYRGSRGLEPELVADIENCNALSK